MKKRIIVLLVAEDNPDDRLLLELAWEEIAGVNLYFVEDGEELIDFLCCRGKYGDSSNAPQPDLILLDLKLPRKNGYEALQEIKTHPNLRKIPIIVLTTSKAESDIISSYDLGANSYFAKPDTFEKAIKLMQMINAYWFETANLPFHSPVNFDES